MQIVSQWEEAPGFIDMAIKLVKHYPEQFHQIEELLDKIVAYVCVNKERPATNKKPYTMSGETAPESYTNSKSYFVKMYNEVWDRSEQQKLALVFSALNRIDPEVPGKIKPLDYADQEIMVKTFGSNWHDREDLPHLLKDRVL